MTTRRSFLASILATGLAPAIGHAGILMPVKKIITTPFLFLSTGGAPVLHSGLNEAYHVLYRYTDKTAQTYEEVCGLRAMCVERLGIYGYIGASTL
jgi:hypothetical protein